MSVSDKCPVVVISGTNSGVGKTSVTIALLRALRQRGLKVQPFKAGPDFLDPTLLTAAAGRDCHNLDTWMMGKEYLLGLFERAASDADVAVVEGVMGLYDGMGGAPTAAGSTAELAKLLSAKVLLVLDAGGMAQSVAAVVKGFCELDSEIQIAGVIANRVGSEKHAKIVSAALEAHNLPPLLGAIPKGAFPELPRRHLGLVKAGSENLSDEILGRFAEAMEKNSSVDSIIKLSRLSPNDRVKPVLPIRKGGAPRIGLALDDAFSFYYKDTLELLEEGGCELVKFSPMNDQRLPSNIDALYFGGGYPEEFCEKLAGNATMLEDVRRFAENGGKIYAECGGLVYLSKGIELTDGSRHPFAGIIPSWTKMNRRFKSLGYTEVLLREDSVVGPAGARIRGHRFHYSELVQPPSESDGWGRAYELTNGKSGDVTLEGYKKNNVLASYVHLHMAQTINHFIRSCAGEL
jgi:cobyrinic acid a,c-diamide synthase